MENNHHDMKDRVLERIKSGDVSMHSRAYFAFKFGLLIIIALLALFVSVIIFTFIIFTIRINLDDVMRHSGPEGFYLFFRLFPWHLLLLDVILIALAEGLLRTFRFCYSSPKIYIAFVLLAFVLALGLFIDRATTFNDDMRVRARGHRLPPPFNTMYEHVHRDDLFPSPASTSVIMFRHI